MGAELLATNLGLWVGLLLSLCILTSLIGDTGLTQLAQHILVGAGLGYAAVLAIRHVLQPWLVAPLLRGEEPQLWAPLVLGLILTAAGLDRMLDQQQANRPGLGRRVLHGLGMVPAALLLGVGVAVGLLGVIQGTLVPQIWRAAVIGIVPSAAPGPFLTGGFTLIVTIAALLHLALPGAATLPNQPRLVRQVLLGWGWLGQRLLWLAAGVIFARLIAARLSLLIGRFEFLLLSLNETQIWAWAETIWQRLLQ
ncbi:MAG: hypothetical protein M3Q45_07890 [Chloroflexota bacterium]|nr:hypothetical protein [Chloroflexota bacterium]